MRDENKNAWHWNHHLGHHVCYTSEGGLNGEPMESHGVSPSQRSTTPSSHTFPKISWSLRGGVEGSRDCKRKLKRESVGFPWRYMDVPKIGETRQNGWFIMENPIKMDDLGVPPFLETSILSYQWTTSSEKHRWQTFYPIDVPVSGFRFLVRCQVTGYSPRPATSPVSRCRAKTMIPSESQELGSPLGSSASSMVDKLSSTDLEFFRSKKPFPTFFFQNN